MSTSPPGEFPLINFFPVYDLLYSQISSSPNRDVQLSEEEIKSLLVKIASMDKTGADMIYIWIRIHSLRHSHSKLLDIPYGGSKLDSKMHDNDIVCDVKFDLREFPAVLNRMLLRFTDLHLRKISEDANRLKELE